jgi:hypothetical protein
MNVSSFVSLVGDNFEFLVIDYGFSRVKESDYQVRFESKNVFVDVRYDADRSYELGVEVGQLKALFDGQERPFNLGEILRVEGVIDKEKYRDFQVSDNVALGNCITKLASLVSSYAKDYLTNNKFSFKRLSDLREKECDQLELKNKLIRIRQEAQSAWKNKDYSRVVDLYRRVENIISESERKKLTFAEKHIK